MRTFILAALGTIAGLILGAAVGILAGLVWTSIFKTSDFEGYSAMLVFFTFGPIGAVLGGLELRLGRSFGDEARPPGNGFTSKARLKGSGCICFVRTHALIELWALIPRFSHLCIAILCIVIRKEAVICSVNIGRFEHSGPGI